MRFVYFSLHCSRMHAFYLSACCYPCWLILEFQQGSHSHQHFRIFCHFVYSNCLFKLFTIYYLLLTYQLSNLLTYLIFNQQLLTLYMINIVKLACLIAIFSLLDSVDCKLYQVVSLCRHGARYHAMDFYDGKETRPLRGQLTAVGMRQNQRLGQLWKKQYIDTLQFLSPNYNRSQIQVISTPYNRTMTSAYSLLYGLYPAGTGPRLTYVDKYLRIPPYSNKTDIQQQNYALPNAHRNIPVKVNQKVMICDCPNYDQFEEKNFAAITEVVQEMNLTYYPFIKRMAAMFNFTVDNKSFLSLTRCFDAASVDLYLGRPLPNGFTNEDYKNLLHLTNWYYYIGTSNDNGYMINTFKMQKIISVFDLRTRLVDNYALRWTMLLGHDTDIWAMHQALNISNSTCTEELYRKGTTSSLQCEQGGGKYASNVIIQLHSDDGKNFYVKVKSNGKYMKICGKANMKCDYLEFKALIKRSITNKNMEELCGKALNPTGSEESTNKQQVVNYQQTQTQTQTQYSYQSHIQ